MNTIFDNLTGNVDLSIFRKSNTDPKTPLRRHYLGLIGLLEYVDILNGDLIGRKLPDGITEETVKAMVIHCIGDLDTIKAMITGGGSSHKYVDLGLPSGTLWATENIKDADGNDLYFAWGETQGYTSAQIGTDKYFTFHGKFDDYEFGRYLRVDETNYGMLKYNNTDELTTLEPEDDATTVNWGEGWKMPTKEEFEELAANTTAEHTEVDGVVGWLFTSTVEGYTDKSIFFPAVGEAYNGNNVYEVGEYGSCWSSSLSSDNVSNAQNFSFSSKGVFVNDIYRCRGCTVRPVRA